MERTVTVRAPGRVNLLGEHTDYTGGLVLPVAIDRFVEASLTPRHDRVLRVQAVSLGAEATFRLEDTPPPPVRHPEQRWANYILGVVAELWSLTDLRGGFDLTLTSDLPSGAGLASSAALAVSIAYAIRGAYGIEATDLQLAQAAQRAEHRYAGVQCGLMDQAVCALGRRNRALLLDCASLKTELVPFEFPDVVIAVVDSGVRHELAASEYNRRVEECRRNDPRRMQHVRTENERVRQGVERLKRGDLEGFGRLMYESHHSLSQVFEVSCPELDTIVQACEAAGAIGAKMSGAGFGGAVVALVREADRPAFHADVQRAYPRARFYYCLTADGASAAFE